MNAKSKNPPAGLSQRIAIASLSGATTQSATKTNTLDLLSRIFLNRWDVTNKTSRSITQDTLINRLPMRPSLLSVSTPTTTPLNFTFKEEGQVEATQKGAADTNVITERVKSHFYPQPSILEINIPTLKKNIAVVKTTY